MFMIPAQNEEVARRDGSAGKEKRKPVRRDPEKRRQQNIQAQRKYRERLRERIDHLEALAASAAQSRPIKETLAQGTSPSGAIITNRLSSTPDHMVVNSLQADDGLMTPDSNSSMATPGKFEQIISQAIDTSSTLTIWDPTTHIDPSLMIRKAHNNCPRLLWTTTINCSCSTPHVQIRTRNPHPFSYGEVKIISFGTSITLPDPHVNSIRIEKTCTIAAMHNLGTYLGITEELFCDDQSPSLFFRSSAESADDTVKANTICTVQEIFKTLKPDLRPRSEQITINHHPYIDILPFPTLRKNLIVRQDEIDEDEFFDDMLTGLVCWGGAGIGRKDREEGTGFASTGTPWDVRSWEARRWFLEKYWSLLGGEDGELVRQSEWWCSIRGDDILQVEAHSRK